MGGVCPGVSAQGGVYPGVSTYGLSAQGDVCLGGVCLRVCVPMGVSAQGGCLPRGVCLEGCLPIWWGCLPKGYTFPPLFGQNS